MKKLLFAAVIALVMTACSRTETYTIEGSFDLPSSVQVGDTVITLPPPAGYVFMCGLDGQPLDSALIEEGKFVFTGIADSKKPYFAYIMSEYAAGMFVVEPGKMKAIIGEPVRISGTPTNDAIVSLMDSVDAIGARMYDDMSVFEGDTLTEEDITPLYTKYSQMVNDLVESLYKANEDNLVGVYCANVMTIQAQSVEEFEALVAPFSDYVRQSELLQQHLTFLKEEAAAAAAGMFQFPDVNGEDNLGN